MRDLTSLLTMSINDSQLDLLPGDETLKATCELSKPIQVVDLFAGPGGLGEGFTSSGEGKRFEIVVSAEKDPKAWQTLRLRAFYRLLKRYAPKHLDEYYSYCNQPGADEFSPSSPVAEKYWNEAAKEARCITLGSESGNKTLDEALDEGLNKNRPWILIGGPPCQAYSIVGRARNQAKADYRAEDDHRHFLYKEYLRIIRERQPTIFVMENVKGILSSKVNNERIFSNILKDLSDPGQALHEGGIGKQYRIYSLVTGASFGPGENVDKIDPRAFIIKAEDFGIPQARHRVILLGIATDSLPAKESHVRLKAGSPKVSVGQVLENLPRLRSSLTKQADTADNWLTVVLEQLQHLCDQIDPLNQKMWGGFHELWREFEEPPESPGSKRVSRSEAKDDGLTGNADLDDWYRDERLNYWLNHEVRGHMPSDLRRYLFAAVYARLEGVSPKGHRGFDLEGLAPDHKNWKTGKFSDRFRVQLKGSPATTITSHISKDGHYFIHYDPGQCRSLSVREAARIQTFPDSYFFQGNRTEQFHQVGNAVPPLLASKIADVVFQLLARKVEAYDLMSGTSPAKEREEAPA
ncbi:TPA: DNA cytosine methyltransferase [Pseudomonas aeruginosa]|uniref:DNA cytosine methyltransferase n=1 Tax=Pseudomonas aeruginosa TaxID=287 RepID=UPI001E5D34E5|nr:DNA (cytosine-5-)-methyltransferase [Pseudomonas aeruginosa]MCS7788628.1 DNA cytosine methyltransferase [Pseudomonas aeruginosa]GLF13303.1 restriction endonuclease subunit M [Pseudomonas aeruginosa]